MERINYTNKHGIELTISEKRNHFWHGKMTGLHEDRYTEFAVKQGKYLLGDGFDTIEDAKKYADTIEF